MTLLILFFCISIFFSFLCSIWEAVLLSVTPSYSSALVKQKSKTGYFFKEAKKDIDKPLSAILTLNTIAHTVGAIGVGAQAGKVFGATYFSLLGFKLTYESLISAVMTLAILVLSEIIPKTIGANNWKRLAPFTASSLKVLLFILKPFVWISQLITNSLKKNKEESVLSRSDYKAMTEEVNEAGEIAMSEYVMIKNLLNLEKLKVKDIMTPKSVIMMADESLTLRQLYDKHNGNLEFSRIPIYKENRDNITGILLKDDLLKEIVKGNGELLLSEIKHTTSYVEESLLLPQLFKELINKNKHISIVTDIYGTIQGLVTMEDLFETLLGKEIVDETDTISDLQKYAKENWEKKKGNFNNKRKD